MLLNESVYSRSAQLSLPNSLVARLKKIGRKVEVEIVKVLRRAVRDELGEGLPDHKEYVIEFSEMYKTYSENSITYILPAYVYLSNPADAEVGEIVHPGIFEDESKKLDLTKDLNRRGKTFRAVTDSQIYKIAPTIDKYYSIKYFVRTA